MVIIGVLNKIEIWSKSKWLKYNETESSSVEDIAQNMANLGL